MTNFLRVLYYLGNAMRRAYWNNDKLRKEEEKRVRSVVGYAYDFVPFYHEKFREAGLKPSDVRTLKDLAKLPITRKRELIHESSRRLVSLEFNLDQLIVERTSGLAGEPFATYRSSMETDWQKAIYMRANISCGQKPRDSWIFVTSPQHFNDTTNIQRRLGIYAQTCVSVFCSVNDQIKLISRVNPDVLDGYSGCLLLLAKEADRMDLKSIQPRIIFGSADLIDVTSRRFMEKVFEAPYYDQFGCTEVDRSAWQCPVKDEYHMDIDSVVTQFVDDAGNEVSAGERGEIVYTTLSRYSMPFIRYAVGDVGIPSDESCPCGRTLPLMKIVEGRKDSFLLLPDGRQLSPMAFRIAVSRFFDRIMQYRVVQKKVDHFKIYIKVKDDSVDEKRLETELTAHVMKVLGLDKYEVTIAVEFTEEMPLSKSGKLMAVVSDLRCS